MQQTVLDDLELERADGPDDLAVVELVREQLGHALVHELVNALGQLLGFHGVGVLDVLEEFRGETGNTLEMKFLAFRQRVTDLEVTRVVKTHDVTGVRLVDNGFLGCHERRGGGELEVLAQADVQVVGVTSEHAGTHFHEGDTVAVVGVHVGVDLEDKTGEFLLVRLHETLVRLAGKRAGSDFDETIQHLADTEVVQCRSEEHGGQLPVKVCLPVDGGVHFPNEFEVFPQLVGRAFTNMLVEFAGIDVVDLNAILNGLHACRVEAKVLAVYVVNTLELVTVTDGPA